MRRKYHGTNLEKTNPSFLCFREDILILLSIIIVSFNCKELTLECIRSIEQTAKKLDLEIIVIDNASVDGSAHAISNEFPHVEVIGRKKNIGFGPACNAGATIARGEYLLLLNPDTIVLPNSIDKLLEFAKKYPGAGIWGGRTLNPDGSLNPKSCWRFPTLWSTFCIAFGLARAFPTSEYFNWEEYGGWDRGTIRFVDVVSGCLLLIRRKLWNALGGFDPIYFLYSEEVDLCLRARTLGARPMLSPDVEIIHYVGGTQNVKSERFIRLFQGKRTYMLKHWPPFKQFVGKILLIVWPLSRYVGLWLWAMIARRKGLMVKARSWKVVWQSRRRWIMGYKPH